MAQPDTDNGLPYIRKDGVANPESSRNGSDRGALARLSSTTETLALAYCFTNDERFAKKAVEFLTTFFLDEQTRMNPNLKFGQAIPGRCEGRDIGIIDTRRLTQVVDSICLIQKSASLDAGTLAQLQSWFREYLDWLQTSKFGISEGKRKNNHGTYYDVQVMALALFTNQPKIARDIAKAAADKRIRSQVGEHGQQPEELHRTRSYSYSVMNLRGLFYLARLAENVEVDLWRVKHVDGDQFLLLRGFLFLEPHFNSLDNWNHQQLKSSKRHSPAYYLITEVADKFPESFSAERRNGFIDSLADLRKLIR